MKTEFRRPEILAPAGSRGKLEAALRFGADAVYLAGERFGMRQASENFTPEGIAEAAELVHQYGARIYLTLNTLPHTGEYRDLEEFLGLIRDVKIDGFIVADLGVMTLLRDVRPDARIHVSTQASVCSVRSALAWAKLGASRLVLARELTLSEIKEIRGALPESVELEAFVHGSMCVSYSGRCLLSNMLTSRDANRGQCSQPCRWNYTLIEEKRPDERIPIEETPLGTFIMSSKDLCLIDHIGQLAAAGVYSFKIEGRVKSEYYAAVVTNAYKIASLGLEKFVSSGGDPAEFTPDPSLKRELESVSHREYCTGFAFDAPGENAQTVTKGGYVRDKSFLAVALTDAEAGEPALFMQKNKISSGTPAELLTPGKTGLPFTVRTLRAEDGEIIDSAPHPGMRFFTALPFAVREGDVIREGG